MRYIRVEQIDPPRHSSQTPRHERPLGLRHKQLQLVDADLILVLTGCLNRDCAPGSLVPSGADLVLPIDMARRGTPGYSSVTLSAVSVLDYIAQPHASTTTGHLERGCPSPRYDWPHAR